MRMQLWLQDPHSVEKLMDMKRLEKKGVLKEVERTDINAHSIQCSVPSEVINKRLSEKASCYLLKHAFLYKYIHNETQAAAFEIHMHICTHNILCAGQQSMLCRSQSSWCDVSTNQDCRHHILY